MLTQCPTFSGHTILSHYPRQKYILARGARPGGRRSQPKDKNPAADGAGEQQPSSRHYARGDAPFLEVTQLAASVAEKDLQTAFVRFDMR